VSGQFIHRRKLEAYKKWKLRKNRCLTLDEAKKMLSEEGYVCIKITNEIKARMDDCLNAENEDCTYCRVNVCLLRFT
jgi:hypothetical protein